MAGTAKTYKKEEAQNSFAPGLLAEIMTQIRNIVTDLETLRAPAAMTAPICVPQFEENDTDSANLTIGSFALIDSDGILRVFPETVVGTMTTMTVTLDTYGSYLFEAKNDGTISHQTPDATASYTTAQLALDAALALTPATDTVAFAVMIIEADAGNWVANTDDFSSDLEAWGMLLLGGAGFPAADLVANNMTLS